MLKNQVIPEEKSVAALGSHFRNARTNLGKSLEEAAQVTCINPTILANLEADDFTKMPAEVFTRGFIKLYAQYLGLDANETLKLYVRQENFDQERPVDQPYRREILTGVPMAHQLSFFRDNRMVVINTILLTVLLAFYVLGAIIKMGQKPFDQITPENELAKSLVDGNTQPLPVTPGEAPAGTEGTGQTVVFETATPATTLPETQLGAAPPASGTPAAADQTAINDGRQPLPTVTDKTAPAPAAPPETTGTGIVVGGTINGR